MTFRNRRNSKNNNNNNNNNTRTTALPEGGTVLGSGSAFVVDSEGYLVTNYHVVRTAYQRLEAIRMAEEMLQASLLNNPITSSNMKNSATPSSSCLLNNPPVDDAAAAVGLPMRMMMQLRPEIYVRINSNAQYQQCRLVQVNPDLDIAVLKLISMMMMMMDDDDDNDTKATTNTMQRQLPAVEFGSSSDLMVGQSLVAIGNPFGLDNTVTTGVVSALNRELPGLGGLSPLPPRRRQRQDDGDDDDNKRNGFFYDAVRAQTPKPLRNCIQTDAAINPGNSGGPLLNLQGKVVGVNTAIISTTGSSAGIGFAVPSDHVAPVVAKIIQADRQTYNNNDNDKKRKQVGYLGLSIIEQPQQQPLFDSATTKNNYTQNEESVSSGGAGSVPRIFSKNWITKVEHNSPAAKAGIKPLYIQEGTTSTSTTTTTPAPTVVYGDAIVAVNGNTVSNNMELQKELKSRILGEQLTITLENNQGERRVVYLVLEERHSPSPSSSL